MLLPLIFTIFFCSFCFSRADLTTKMRLDTEALDRLLCPMVSRSVNTRLRSTSVLTWTGATSDESVSAVHIGVPPADTQCRYALSVPENGLRLFLAWSLAGTGDLELKADMILGWKDGIRADCNASVSTDQKIKTRLDEENIKEGICKELMEYFVQTPTIVVYPIWADLNLMYSLKSIIVTDRAIEIDFSTLLEPPNSVFTPRPVSLTQNEGMIHLAFDQNVINAIFDSLYQKNQGLLWTLSSETTPNLRSECGNGAVTAVTCLGSFLESVFPNGSPNKSIDLDIMVDTVPLIKIGGPDGLVLKTSGTFKIMRYDGSNSTLASFAARVISRFNTKITTEKRIKAGTSANDIALMASDFELMGIKSSDENFNATTLQIVKSLAPILIDLINDSMGIGLPLPLPQNLKMTGMNIAAKEAGFEVWGEMGSV